MSLGPGGGRRPSTDGQGHRRMFSWYGNDQGPDDDGISLDVLDRSNTAYSGYSGYSEYSSAGILGGDRSHQTPNQLPGGRNRASTVLQGARHLFFGEGSEQRRSRISRAEDDEHSSDSDTDTAPPHFQQRRQPPSQQRAGGAGGVDHLLDFENLDFLRAGLEEALGTNADNKGSWLVADDAASDRPPSRSPVRSPGRSPARTPGRSPARSPIPSTIEGTGGAIIHAPDLRPSDARYDSVDLESGAGRRSPNPPPQDEAGDHGPVSGIAATLKDLSDRVIGEGPAGSGSGGTTANAAQRHNSVFERKHSIHVDRHASTKGTASAAADGPPPVPTLSLPTDEYRPDRLSNLWLQPDALVSDDSLSMVSHRRAQSPGHADDTTEYDTEGDVLVGKSLTIFGPENRVRRTLHRILHQPWVQPLVFLLLVLHMFVLSWELSHSVFGDDPADGPIFHAWGAWWGDIVLLAIFLCYSVEIAAKIIVQGFWYDDPHSAFPGWIALFRDAVQRARIAQAGKQRPEKPLPPRQHNFVKKATREVPVVLGTFTHLMRSNNNKATPVERAFLRSSWNRVDFLSTVCYWISLLLTINGVDIKHKLFVFRALSSLRLWRLLNLTRGTSSILRSLKNAAPLLLNVSTIIGFFWYVLYGPFFAALVLSTTNIRVLFSIIGVQSFKSSLRRTCIWVDPEGIEANYSTGTFCGSYFEPQTLNVLPYVLPDGTPGGVAKGFTCPVNSVCVVGDNPYSGTLSFDTIYNSLEMVFVVMSTNTFTDIMYDTMATDYLVSSLFFVFGVLVLSWWLINLLVAVIAVSFRLEREEALNGQRRKDFFSHVFGFFSNGDGPHHSTFLLKSTIGKFYHRTRYLWLAFIAADIIAECTVDSRSSQRHVDMVYHFHGATAGVMLIDLILRFAGYLPYWRYFFRSKGNVLDLFLGIANVIILLPFVHNHDEVYNWLTVFQVARFYRIPVSVKFVRSMWSRVLGSYRAVFNLTAFYFLMVFLVSIMAGQMLRGVVPFEDDSGDTNDVSFFDLGNSFIGMYQISSTENWTDVMYAAIESAPNAFLVICYGLFFVGWFILSNFIVLNMFVAVITENLEVSPEEKRKGQIRQFINSYVRKMNQTHTVLGGLGTIRKALKSSKLKVWKGGEDAAPDRGKHDDIFDMLLKRHVVEDFLDEEEAMTAAQSDNESTRDLLTDLPPDARRPKTGVLDRITGAVLPKWRSKILPWDANYKQYKQRRNYKGVKMNDPTTAAHTVKDWQTTRLKAQETFLSENPDFDRALFYFRNDNRLRRFCQRIVASSFEERVNGVNPRPIVWHAFQIFMFSITICMVVTSCINTPYYYKMLQLRDIEGWNWVMWCDVGFCVVFTLEAIIKIIADGFKFAPNAYLNSTFNIIDFIVLITLWITVFSNLFSQGHASRYVRAVEAFRALRLLNISSSAMDSFYSVFIFGFGKMLGAAMLSLCLLFPFSVWGKSIYSGRLSYCTDDSLELFSDCVDEYFSSPFNWDIMTPRAITKDYFDYDTFGHSFLIQFGVISLEGWIDVLNAVMAITGTDSNPQPFASRYNGIFPVLYNILGTIFILTVFVSVIIKNYAQNRGSAYLTDDQLAWYEIEKVLKVVRPVVVPPKCHPRSIRGYLQKLSLNTKSWMHKVETGMLFIVLLLLLTEFYPWPGAVDTAYVITAMVASVVFLATHLVKFVGLGFRAFIRSEWYVFGLVVSFISFLFSVFGATGEYADVFRNFRKLGLVGMMLLWIPRSRRLDQLFKTGLASAKEIGNLLIAWFVLFLCFAIAFNQSFGLTRIGSNGDENLNVRTVPKALILLFRMSCGEGWNQIMSDYLVSPPYCTPGNEFTETDCGNHVYAYILFCAWNILSMYIFVNMFVSLIYENFSYFFHRPWDVVTNEDIQEFRQTWSKFDPKGTGYISPDLLHQLLRTTTGYFSMKIYDDNFTVPTILRRSQARIDDDNPYDVDFVALNSVIRQLPAEVYKQKRRSYERFCTMALLEADERGISFGKLMRLFPLFKSMDENRCLKYVCLCLALKCG